MSVIVLLETAGTQRYLFATSKRRETVGASGLVARLPEWGKEWSAEHQEFLTLQSISGKLLVAVENVDLARSLITHVTTRATQQAAGLDVAGCFAICDPQDPATVHAAVQRVHRIIGQARSLRPSALQRHRMFPGLEPCEISGLPASQMVAVGGNAQARRSVSSRQKLEAAGKRIDDLALMLNTHRDILNESLKALDDENQTGGRPSGTSAGFENDLSMAEDGESLGAGELQRIATIHLDVNGLGILGTKQIEDARATLTDLTSIAALYRELSETVERAMRKAVEEGCHDAIAQGYPLLPIVIGGDDVTIVCKASIAHSVTMNILLAFERAMTATPFGRLSAAAGICYSRRQFPFSIAHEIASELCSSAKQVKSVLAINDNSFAHASAFDAHVVLDSSPSSLAAIRETGTFGDRLSWSGPYVVAGPTGDELESLSDSQRKWLELHDVAHLEVRIEAVKAKNPVGENCIPRGQLQSLRSEIVTGAMNSDTEFSRLLMKNDSLRSFVEPSQTAKDSMWFIEPDAPTLTYKTRVIDALIHADIRQEPTK
jgi:hypothetical protein